jgi:hypothetical protein
VKIIGFSSIDRTLLIYPQMKLIELKGCLSIEVGERSCIGKWDGPRYIPCSSANAPVCHHCKASNACTMCKGICLKDEKTCTEEHVVYLAMFRPDVLKVGVSKSSRFERRLIEQGADVGALISSCPDGEIARKTEHALQKKHNLQNNVRLSKKIKLEAELNLSVWEKAKEKLNAHSEVWLNYFDGDLWMRPLPLNGAIRGKVVGLKGRLLIVDDKNTLYLCDLNNLLGAKIFPAGILNRQTSLAHF